MASDLAECEQFFAVMRFPDHATDAGSSEVFANVLAYDEGKFCPFGVGDFLRGKKKRWKASAPAICSSDLPQNDLPSVVPQFGAIDVAISGETLALTARLFGPPAYWKSAKPKFLVTGQDATRC